MYKRYEKYKDSGVEWIGEIPKHWEVSRNKYIAKYINGYAFKPEDWSDKGIKIIRIQNLTNSNSTYNFFEGEIDEKYLVIKGDILLSWSASLGLFVWDDEKAWLNQHIFKVVPNVKMINRDFYIWLSSWFVKEMIKDIHGSTMQHITKDKFGSFAVYLPPLFEQRIIAKVLNNKTSEIDSLIADKEELIKKLEEYKQSIIAEAVTKGLNPDVKMKDSGIEWIGEIPEHWDVVKLSYLSKENFLYGANEVADSYDPQLPRYIRITDIDVDGKLREETACSLAWGKAKPYLLNYNDILFARSGATVGKTYIHKDSNIKACFAGYLIRFVADRKKVRADLIYYYTASISYNSWVILNTIQATIQNVSAEKYGNLAVPLPSIEEQDFIIQHLNEKTEMIDSLIANVNEHIEKLIEYRKSLIYEAVTGKIKTAKKALEK
jgi:type I restriction enzyme, S subunit